MVYRKATGKTYYTRVGRRVVSCGTPLKSVAQAMEAWVAAIAARHDLRGVLAAIVAKRVTLVEAYRLGEASTADWLAAQEATAADINLRPLLERFLDWRRARTKGAASVETYRRQVLAVFPEPVWPRSTFTAAEVSRRLDALLGIGDATRNRYRAALGAFAKFLVRDGVLTHNPVRDTDAYRESDPHVHWYEEADAKRLIAALPLDQRVREALMAGCGLDLSDSERVTVEDVDLAKRTVRCHGSKSYRRNRVVRITEAWTIPYIREGLRGKRPTALVCTGNRFTALKVHNRTVAALKLKASTLHDWRHHYVVTGLRRGERIEVLAYQLGNTVPVMIQRYAPYIPREADYQPELATDPATTTQKEA